MSVAISPSEPAALPGYIRAKGRVRMDFTRNSRGTRIETLSESGGFRVKFPRGSDCEAVLVNTAGGMSGGDTLDVAVTAAEGTDATITTQSAEKIYRSDAVATRITAGLKLGPASRLMWAPQETILFAGSRLTRSLTVDMADDATLLAAESITFGRLAMGEELRSGSFSDRWRVRRDGRLVFAEEVRMFDDIAATLDRPAVGQGARATATILYVAPDAAARLDDVRALLTDMRADAAAGSWDGLLVVRAVFPEPAAVRVAVAAALSHLSGRSLPRVWGC